MRLRRQRFILCRYFSLIICNKIEEKLKRGVKAIQDIISPRFVATYFSWQPWTQNCALWFLPPPLTVCQATPLYMTKWESDYDEENVLLAKMTIKGIMSCPSVFCITNESIIKKIAMTTETIFTSFFLSIVVWSLLHGTCTIILILLECITAASPM